MVLNVILVHRTKHGCVFPEVLAVAVCLFGFSTVLAVGYYGLQVSAYLFGASPWKNRLYLVYFCGTLPLGALVDTTTVINLTDSLFFLLSVPNIIGLYLMSGEVRRDTEAYFSLVKDGKA